MYLLKAPRIERALDVVTYNLSVNMYWDVLLRPGTVVFIVQIVCIIRVDFVFDPCVCGFQPFQVSPTLWHNQQLLRIITTLIMWRHTRLMTQRTGRKWRHQEGQRVVERQHCVGSWWRRFMVFSCAYPNDLNWFPSIDYNRRSYTLVDNRNGSRNDSYPDQCDICYSNASAHHSRCDCLGLLQEAANM